MWKRLSVILSMQLRLSQKMHRLVDYGTYLYQIGRYNHAIDQLQVAGSTLGYDERYRALENLGRAYLQVGRVAEAEAAFKQAYR